MAMTKGSLGMTPGMSSGVEATVLIVDDQEADCAAVREILATAGSSTIMSCCSEEAMLVLGSTSPDLVLLTTSSPAIDGSAVLRMIRNNRRLMRVPVVMTKPKATVADKAEAFAAGANGFVAKPFCEDELLAEVGWLLAHARRMAA